MWKWLRVILVTILPVVGGVTFMGPIFIRSYFSELMNCWIHRLRLHHHQTTLLEYLIYLYVFPKISSFIWHWDTSVENPKFGSLDANSWCRRTISLNTTLKYLRFWYCVFSYFDITFLRTVVGTPCLGNCSSRCPVSPHAYGLFAIL